MERQCQKTVRGLNPWARRFVSTREVVGTDYVNSVYIGGRRSSKTSHITEPLVKKEESGEYCVDIFGQYHSLYKYTLPNGKVYYEVVQNTTLLSGPVVFLALQDKHGEIVPESIWSIEEMSRD